MDMKYVAMALMWLSFAVATVAAEEAVHAVQYNANYDAILDVEGQTHRLQSRARFAASEPLPISVGKYELRIQLQPESDRFKAQVELYTREQGTWMRMAASPTFAVQLGSPIEFKWSSDLVQLDLALVVSQAR